MKIQRYFSFVFGCYFSIFLESLCPIFDEAGVQPPHCALVEVDKAKNLPIGNMMRASQEIDAAATGKSLGQVVLGVFGKMQTHIQGNKWSTEELIRLGDEALVAAQNTYPKKLNVNLAPDADDTDKKVWQQQVLQLGRKIRFHCEQEGNTVDCVQLGIDVFSSVSEFFRITDEIPVEQRKKVGQLVQEKSHIRLSKSAAVFGKAILDAVEKNTRNLQTYQKKVNFNPAPNDYDTVILRLLWHKREEQLGRKIRFHCKQEGNNVDNVQLGIEVFSGVWEFFRITNDIPVEQREKVGYIVLKAFDSTQMEKKRPDEEVRVERQRAMNKKWDAKELEKKLRSVKELSDFGKAIFDAVQMNTWSLETYIDTNVEPVADDAYKKAWQHQFVHIGIRVRGRCEQENKSAATIGESACFEVSNLVATIKEQQQKDIEAAAGWDAGAGWSSASSN